MKTFVTLCCLALTASLRASCVEAETPAEDNFSFQEIQELLDRFSDATMRSIEEQMRSKLDAYEKSLEKAREDQVREGNEGPPPTYRLVFRISQESAPMSVLSTAGHYTLSGQQGNQETQGRATVERGCTLRCEGDIEPGEPGHVSVTFNGTADLRINEVAETNNLNHESSISFSGSGQLALGAEHEIARNDDLSVMLQIESIAEPPVAEATPTH